MYTSYIGKKFLEIYNEKENKNLSAEEFFNGIFFKLFFTDDAHLMHVGNSPFFQKPKAEDVNKFGGKSLAQLNNLKNAIAMDTPNMSIFVGSSAKDVGGTTSGQVSDIDFKIDADEMYASWIGEALGIGVIGRYVMLTDNSEILWSLFEGWKHYRKYLNHTPNLKDKEVEFWNAHWFAHYFNPLFNKENPLNNLFIETETSEGQTRIKKQGWSEVVFSFVKIIPNRTIMIYGYQLDKTNTTLGFINIYLPEIKKMYELRDILFIDKNESILSDKEIEQLSTFFNFKDACQFGTIGLKSLEPANLREYMPKGSLLTFSTNKFRDTAKGKEFKFLTEESFLHYQLYKIWITAMLNKTELLNLASEVATALIEFEKGDERGKKIFATISQDVRETSNLKSFIDKITEVLSHSPTNGKTFKAVVEQVLKIPTDNFPLFITLIRFEYTYQKSKN